MAISLFIGNFSSFSAKKLSSVTGMVGAREKVSASTRLFPEACTVTDLNFNVIIYNLCMRGDSSVNNSKFNTHVRVLQSVSKLKSGTPWRYNMIFSFAEAAVNISASIGEYRYSVDYKNQDSQPTAFQSSSCFWYRLAFSKVTSLRYIGTWYLVILEVAQECCQQSKIWKRETWNLLSHT